jgi:Mn2+/Fe2+ NRAMP family transporter
MLLGLPLIFLVILLTGSVIVLEVFVPYKTYSRILKNFALTLLSYILATSVVKLDWRVVFNATLVLHLEFSADYLLNTVAILGTTISPYMFFWQASQEVEKEIVNGQISEIDIGKPCVTRRGITEMDGDTCVGMFFSQVIMFFIIVTTAATLHAGGITTIQTATQAAEALRPLAGDLSDLLFVAGIIGMGLLAVPVLAGSSAYAISEMAVMKGAWQEAESCQGVLRNNWCIYAYRHVPRLAWYQPDNGSSTTRLRLNGRIAPPLMALVIMIANRKAS